MKTARKKPPTSRFVIIFPNPKAKKRHVQLVTGTNTVGPRRILIGGLKF